MEAATDTKSVSSGPQPASPVTITPKAIEMMKDAMAREGLQGHGIRIGVLEGGCSGFQYMMDFEKERRDNDLAFEQEGVKLFVDPLSSKHLQGATIDYVVGPHGAGFKFTNPNAKSACGGCGSSCG